MSKKIKWKIIKQHPDYFISNDGKQIISIKNNKRKFISITDNGNGYKRVYLYTNGKRTKWLIHRLVATVFKQNPQPLLYTQVHHLDHDKANNDSDNVIWTTPKLNCWYRDQYYKGLKNAT